VIVFGCINHVALRLPGVVSTLVGGHIRVHGAEKFTSVRNQSTSQLSLAILRGFATLPASGQ